MITIERAMRAQALRQVEALSVLLFEGEVAAHEFVIAPETGMDFTGCAVTARFVRADGQNVAINGTLTDGSACVTLTASCYASPGAYKLFIYVTDANETVCVYACAGQVLSTVGANGTAGGAESIIDPVAVTGLTVNAAAAGNDWDEWQALTMDHTCAEVIQACAAGSCVIKLTYYGVNVVCHYVESIAGVYYFRGTTLDNVLYVLQIMVSASGAQALRVGYVSMTSTVTPSGNG